jgi:hypothetical protein
VLGEGERRQLLERLGIQDALGQIGLRGGRDEAFELAQVLGLLAEEGLLLLRQLELALGVANLLIEGPHFLARLLADGALAEAHRADFDRVASLGKQAVGNNLLR